MRSSIRSAALWAGLLLGGAQAEYSIATPDDIKTTAATILYDLMKLYTGNQTGMMPGILPGPPDDGLGPYYWWQGGAMWGTIMDYWYYTGDESYNHVVTEGMLAQVGENKDYQPEKFTVSLGNDDQGFWGMSAMLAAENKFPDPPKGQPQWLALAQAVWTTQASPERHDKECNGGMRWQIPVYNTGYDYKNTIANGCFFNLGARLARYTNNATYAKYAEETWDWLWGVNYIDHQKWLVYDGGHVQNNCTDLSDLTYSYNAGVLIQGLAMMYNYTDGDDKWGKRLTSLVDATLNHFLKNNTFYEINCEFIKGQCSQDMLTYKGYMHRWLTQATTVAPTLLEAKILPILKKSAQKAINVCNGGATGRVCGFYWAEGQWYDPGVDKTTGAGEYMNALAAVSSLLVTEKKNPAPVTNTTGGTSEGDPLAGTKSTHHAFRDVTTGDRAGAAILTILLVVSVVSTCAWMSWDTPAEAS